MHYWVPRWPRHENAWILPNQARVFLNFSCHFPFFAVGAVGSAAVDSVLTGPESLYFGLSAIVFELGCMISV